MVLVTKKAKTPPIHHQKRHGQHHKRTKPYEKTYWPYLPLLAIAGISLVINFAWTGLSQPVQMGGAVLGASTGFTQQALLTETNQDRAEQHIGSLTLDGQLTTAAQAKADDMAAKNYWAHNAPDGTTPWKFVQDSGYRYVAAGENLAYGFADSDQVLKAWMNSAEHRANVLNGAYQNVGFGVARPANYQGAHDQVIVVALYGKPIASVAGVAPNQTANDLPARQMTRVDLYAGNVLPGALTIVIVTATAAAALFVWRHLRFARRVFVHSEEFIVRHPMLDVALVTVAAAGVLLSRTAGFIH